MNWQGIEGWFDWRAIYDDWAREARPGEIIVEIGSWYGRSTCYGAGVFGAAAKEIRFVAVDHCVGALKGSDPSAMLKGRKVGTIAGDLHRNILECGVQDSVMLLVTTSVRAASLFPDGSVGFVLVDGGHQKQMVLEDLEAWWPKLRPGGEMAGHDYEFPGVTQAVDEFFGRACLSSRSKNCWEIRKP